MGEYGVIEGGKALILALKPPFVFSKNENEGTSFHPESPVAKLFKSRGRSSNLKLMEAGLGAGFGGSTAEMIAGAWACDSKLPDTQTLWREYKEYASSASGADLIAQCEAIASSQSLFLIEEKNKVTPLPRSILFDQTFLFSVGQTKKLATHEALASKRDIKIDRYNEWVTKLQTALQSKSEEGLIVLSEFANELHEAGLETEFANQIRKSFEAVPGVIGVKGCGAGLNDVFLVAIKKSEISNARTSVKTTATKFDLHFWGSLSEHAW